MKKPIISLAAIERVDAVPLRTALDRHRKVTSEIAAARLRESALRKEIKNFLESVDPDDAKAIHIISGKRIQSEIIPSLIEKAERGLANECAPALLLAADQFQSGLKRYYAEAHEALAVQIGAMFKPYFSDRPDARDGVVDRARSIAIQTDDCQAVARRLQEVESIRLPLDKPRSNQTELYDRELSAAAEALLALADRN